MLCVEDGRDGRVLEVDARVEGVKVSDDVLGFTKLGFPREVLEFAYGLELSGLVKTRLSGFFGALTVETLADILKGDVLREMLRFAIARP